MNNIYDDTGNNNEPDYSDNLAFDPNACTDKYKIAIDYLYYVIQHHTKNPSIHIGIMKKLGLEVPHDSH